MITRSVVQDDLKILANIMRKSGTKEYSSTRKLARYQAHGGQIAVTHYENGQVVHVIMYRLDPILRYAKIDALVMADERGGQLTQAALQLRCFLTSMLKAREMDYVVCVVHDPVVRYVKQLTEIGFLCDTQCEECRGGTFVFSNSSEHVGALLIERILHGHAEVYQEV